MFYSLVILDVTVSNIAHLFKLILYNRPRRIMSARKVSLLKKLTQLPISTMR